MDITVILRVAIRTLTKHKLRSLLTTLGIIIGVTAIITVMSIGQGAKQRVRQEIEKLGTNFIIALSKPAKQKMMMGKKRFKQSTLNAIRRECEGIAVPVSIGVGHSIVAPYPTANDEIQRMPNLLNEVHRFIEEKRLWCILTGSSARKLKNADVNLLAGRALLRRLHPFLPMELGDEFDVSQTLRWGSIPLLGALPTERYH